MALAAAKPALVNAIKGAMDAAMTASQNKDANVDTVKTNFANALADAMETFIKAGQVTLPPASVNVTGTATAQSNPAPIVVLNAID